MFVDVVALFPLGNIGFFVLTYANTFQLVAHAAIAINRYDVIARKPGRVSGDKMRQFDSLSNSKLFRPGAENVYVSWSRLSSSCLFRRPQHESLVA